MLQRASWSRLTVKSKVLRVVWRFVGSNATRDVLRTAYIRNVLQCLPADCWGVGVWVGGWGEGIGKLTPTSCSDRNNSRPRRQWRHHATPANRRTTVVVCVKTGCRAAGLPGSRAAGLPGWPALPLSHGIHDCMLSPWRWLQMPTELKPPTQTKIWTIGSTGKYLRLKHHFSRMADSKFFSFVPLRSQCVWYPYNTTETLNWLSCLSVSVGRRGSFYRGIVNRVHPPADNGYGQGRRRKVGYSLTDHVQNIVRRSH